MGSKRTMKRCLSVILALSMVFGVNTIPTLPVYAQETEAKTEIPGWSKTADSGGLIEISTDYAKSGEQSLHIVDNSDQEYLEVISSPVSVTGSAITVNDGAIQRGKEYKVKANMYLVRQVNSLSFIVRYFNEAGSKISDSTDVLFNTKGTLKIGEWNTMEISVTPPANATGMSIMFICQGKKVNEIDAYIDDISIVEASTGDEVINIITNAGFEEGVSVPPIEPEPPVDPNPDLTIPDEVQNPGFESPLEGGKIPNWQIGAGTDGIMSLNTEKVRTGTNSLYFYDNDGTKMFRVISDKFKVEPSTSYIAQAFAYVISQSHNVVFETYYYDAADKQIGVRTEMFSSVSLGTEKWTAIKVASTAPANTAYARIAFYSGGVSITEAYFDDVILEKIEANKSLDREYGEAIDLGEMVKVNLGQAATIGQNALGEWEVYFVANGLTGTFYVLDAFTGAVKFKEVLPNTGSAVWAITIGADKNVYVGSTADGKLYQYVAAEKRVESLGAAPLTTWIWDLEATPDGKIYGGTFADKKGGRVFEYDIATKTFRDYGIISEGKDYVRGIAVDDTYIYAALGAPKQLVKIDRVSGIVTNIPVAGHSNTDGIMDNVFVINGKLFVSVSTINMVVLNMDTYEIENIFQYSNMLSMPHPKHPNLIYYKGAMDFASKLYQYDVNTHQSTEIMLPEELPEAVRVKDMAFISETAEDEPILAMITQNGEYVLIDPLKAGVKLSMMPNVGGSAVTIQALESWNKDGKLYLGGYQRGMSIYNPYTNTIEKNLPSFPQPEGIGFLNDYVYFGTYVGSIMYRYNPELQKDKEPEFVYDIENHQDRPFAFASGDNKLFVGNVADYGMLGGSLAIYDEPTDTWVQYDEVVEDQAIIGLAYKDGLLYGSTTVWGGLGINPTKTEAKIFVWDVAAGKKIDEFTPSIPFIDETPKMIGELLFGPDGYLWGIVEGTLFALDVATKEVVKSIVVSPSLYNTSKWKPFRIEWAPDGIMYTTLGRKLVAIDTETMAYKVIYNDMLNDMTVGIDGTIYFAPKAGTTLSKIEVPETNATLSSITVGGELIPNFSPGTLEYKAARQSNMALEVITKIDGAIAEVVTTEDQTQIYVVAKDGKSTLTYTINWTETDTEIPPVVVPPVNPPAGPKEEPKEEPKVDGKKYLEQVQVEDNLLLYVGGTKDNTANLSLTYPSTLVEVETFSTYTVKDKVEMIITTTILERVEGKAVKQVSGLSGEVISLDKQGTITAKKEGTATITTVIVLKDGTSKSYTTVITVEKASISFTKSASNMHVGEKTNFRIKVKGYDINTLEWKTKKVGVATVGKNIGKLEAKVTGKTAGKDTLYVRVKDAEGKWVNEEVSVTVEKASITFKNFSSKMKVGDKATFTVEVKGYDLSTLEWRTKEVSIVTVGRNTGKLKATVKAKSRGKDILYVRVKDNNGKWVTKNIPITVSKAN